MNNNNTVKLVHESGAFKVNPVGVTSFYYVDEHLGGIDMIFNIDCEKEDLKREIEALIDANETLEREIRKQEGYYQTLLDKVDDLESYNAELEAENNRLRTAYENERNKPMENTDALHASIDILTKEKASLKESNRKLVNTLDDLREENMKLKDYIIQMIIK